MTETAPGQAVLSASKDSSQQIGRIAQALVDLIDGTQDSEAIRWVRAIAAAESRQEAIERIRAEMQRGHSQAARTISPTGPVRTPVPFDSSDFPQAAAHQALALKQPEPDWREKARQERARQYAEIARAGGWDRYMEAQR